jgi:hypothetical protein
MARVFNQMTNQWEDQVLPGAVVPPMPMGDIPGPSAAFVPDAATALPAPVTPLPVPQGNVDAPGPVRLPFAPLAPPVSAAAPKGADQYVAPPAAPKDASMGMAMQPSMLTTTDNTTQTQTSTTSGKDTRGLQAANKQLGDVTKAGGELEGRQQLAKGEAGLEIAAQKAQDLEELQAQDALRKATLEAEKQKVDQSVNEQANFQFDANRFYKRMGTGQAVAAGVGIALGALAQGFGQKSNIAIDMLDKQVDKDLQQQQMEYSKLKDKTAAANSGYGMMRQMGLDDKEASLKFKEMAVNNLQSKLEAGLTKQFGPEVAAQKASEAVANQRAKLEEQKVAAQGQTTKSVSSITKTEQRENPKVLEAANTAAIERTGGLLGYDKKPITGESAVKVGHYRGAMDEVEAMRNLVKNGSSTFKLIGDNDFTRAMGRAAENFGRAQSGGAINTDEEKRFRQMFRNLTDNKEETLKRLDEAQAMLSRKYGIITSTPYSPPKDMSSPPKAGEKY